ncbi:MAG: tetratricopeptide repeat protein [Thermodesulfovibrionales bacterium]|nr:tetratricopeptide repeat protein [Thermodesulfovibrionales bacterium]
MNKPISHILLIIILGLLAYSNTFHVPFLWDDIGHIVENPKLKYLSNFWPPSGARWLGFLTFVLNYHFGGLNTIGYHIVNLIIHIFNSILVYWLVVLTFRTPYFKKVYATSNEQRATGNESSTMIALFSALLFVSHPIQTQAVTYIVQRFTSLATMFYLLSLVMYIKAKFVTQNTEKVASSKQSVVSKKLYATRYTLYAVSLVSAILAMKTKEISFTLPIIIVLYEFMFFGGKIKRRILFLMPIILTMLIIPLSLIGIDKPIGDAIGELKEAAQETGEIPRWSYLFTQFRVIVTYIRLLFLPINQNVDYDYPLYHSFFNPAVFLSFLFLLLIFAFGIYLLYAKRYTLYASRFLAFGIFWFFITLSVESSIIPIRDVIFEHRVYLPSVGFVVALTAAVGFVTARHGKRTASGKKVFAGIMIAVILALSGAAYARNAIWKDSISLWEDTVKKSPEKARPHNNLGSAYAKQGRIDEAVNEYKTALKIKPDFNDALYNLGISYFDQGRIDEAIREYKVAIMFKPGDVDIHNNLGVAYYRQGRIDEAINEYKAALKINPDYAKGHNNLGLAYAGQGRFNEAISEYKTALQLEPDFAGTRRNLEFIYMLVRMQKK